MKEETADNLHQWMATASPEGMCTTHHFSAWHSALWLTIPFQRTTDCPENVEICGRGSSA